jgi:two-component system sensor histidine kinase DesK
MTAAEPEGRTPTGRIRIPVRPIRPSRSERPALIWLVTVTTWLVLAFMCFLAFGSLATQTDPWLTPLRRQIGAALIVVTVGGFVVLHRRLLRRAASRTLLVGLVTATCAILNSVASDTWALDCVAVAAMALVVPRRWAVAAGAGTWFACIAVTLLRAVDDYVEVLVSITTLLVASVLFSLTRLAGGLSEAYFSREHHALVIVDAERHRISRGLHDIMGRVLVAATLRNEAALQLLDHDIERSREQLEQMQKALQQGQAELRRLVAGHVFSTLPGELESGGTLCRRLGIRWVLDADDLPEGRVAVLAAAVVREGVTNMLKHSNAMTCEVTIRTSPEVTVAVVNDGDTRAVSAAASGSTGGTGIAELRRQIEAAGGRIEIGPIENERFRLAIALPATAS